MRIRDWSSDVCSSDLMMVAARAPELIHCAAGLSGLYDLEAFATDSDTASTAYGRSYISRALGNDKAQWLANSPVLLAAGITAPVFLAHGEIDERTPYKQAVEMKKELEAAGRMPEWMSEHGEARGFYKEENKAAFYKRIEAFF